MNQERNATKDSSLSQDQVRKLQDGVKDANPFDDESEEWDDGGAYALVDNGEPGVPVRTLYDYEAAEQDELTFKSGT